MPEIPHAPMAVNQRIITGPNTRPTAAVPLRWTRKSTTMIAAVIGTTASSSDGSTTLSPSTAESTEIAGVIMLSPKNSDAPKTPSAARTTVVLRPRCEADRRSRVISAVMPPSPSLSARIASRTYVTRTMTTTDQKMSETTPVQVLRGDRYGVRVLRVEHGLQGVDRAGADVTEDHAEGTDRQCEARQAGGTTRVTG